MLAKSIWKRLLILPILTVLTAGFIFLFLYWSVNLRLLILFKKVRSINEASHILVIATRNQSEIIELFNRKFRRNAYFYSLQKRKSIINHKPATLGRIRSDSDGQELSLRISNQTNPADKEELLRRHKNEDNSTISFVFRFSLFYYNVETDTFIPVEFDYTGKTFCGLIWL